MDDTSFDRLTRALGRGISRRRASRGLLGAAVALVAGIRGEPAGAQPGITCHGVGGLCGAEAWCCGSLLCIDGACVVYDDYINTLGDTTDDILVPDGSGGVGSLRLGESCGDPAQCYAGSVLDTTCGDNGIDPGGVCCTFYGFGCASDRHCCGGLSCIGNVCTVPYEGYG